MITAEETGLTSEQWDSLTESVIGATFQLQLYKWNPTFEVVVSGEAPAHDFDAIVHNGQLYRATSAGVYSFDTAWMPLGSLSQAEGQLDTPPSLVSDTLLYLFAPTVTGISRRSWDGSAWSDWVEIVTDASVWYIAATDKDTVHFVTYDSTNHRYRFQVAQNSDGWTTTGSDIYWGFPITSFAAKRIDGRDVLVFTSELPGVLSTQVVGTQVVKNVLPAGGVCGLTYQFGTWSDHFEIDPVDQWSSFRYRENVCLSRIDDTLWLMVYSSEGTAQTPVTGCRISSSKNGIHWSRGELFPLPENSSQGAILLRLEETLYALTHDATYAAPSTLWFGLSASGQDLDVTAHSSQVHVSRQDIQQISLTISNELNWIGTSILNGENTLALVLKTGYGFVAIPIGLFEVDSFDFPHEGAVRTVQLTARDRFAWMTGRSQSEQFQYWLPQAVGMDDYVDNTGTGYGGMSHTAPFKGSYKASDGSLQLKSSNEEGIAASTFMYDAWNGAVDAHTQLATLVNAEHTGLVFRMQDKDNTFIYRYDQASDTLQLIKRAGGEDTILWQSSAKGWSSEIHDHGLRSEFRYCRIKLYAAPPNAANMGSEWALEQSLLVAGEDPAVRTLVPSGYVGTIGKGYSAEDSFGGAPPPLPAPVLPPAYPDYAPPPAPAPAPDSNPFVPCVEAQIAAGFRATLVGDNLQFTDLSVSSGGEIVTWDWRLNYSSTHRYEQNPVVPLSSFSFGNVKLIVTDACGHSATIEVSLDFFGELEVTEQACWRPLGTTQTVTASLYYHPQTADNRVVDFNGYAYGTPAVAWLWDFGDGTTSTEQNPTHTFDDIGHHSVCLHVWTADGSQAMETYDVYLLQYWAVRFNLGDGSKTLIYDPSGHGLPELNSLPDWQPTILGGNKAYRPGAGWATYWNAHSVWGELPGDPSTYGAGAMNLELSPIHLIVTRLEATFRLTNLSADFGADAQDDFLVQSTTFPGGKNTFAQQYFASVVVPQGIGDSAIVNAAPGVLSTWGNNGDDPYSATVKMYFADWMRNWGTPHMEGFDEVTELTVTAIVMRGYRLP